MTWQIIGHSWAVASLQRDITGNHLAHAYLFTGAEGIGKKTIALELAQAINCETPPAPGVPCGNCRTCRLLAAGRHPDLSIVKPEGANGKIPVDSIRSLIQAISLKPLEARWRIALLPDFQVAPPSAANALLKTLEEPPPSTILLLTAETADDLLPTIVSRCRVMALRPLPVQEVSDALQQRWHLAPDRAALLARLSCGRLGWAVGQIPAGEEASERSVHFEEWNQILRGSRAERFTLAQRIADEREEVQEILQSWESFCQDLLLLTLSPDAQITNLDYGPAIAGLAKTIAPETAKHWLEALRRVETQIEHNANLRLALETAFLDAPGI